MEGNKCSEVPQDPQERGKMQSRNCWLEKEPIEGLLLNQTQFKYLGISAMFGLSEM